MVTLSVIKADIGGWVGHARMHPDLQFQAKESLSKAKKDGLLIDFHVTSVGDDVQLIMTHNEGEGSERIHKMAWETFLACTEVAKKLHLYGAGQDLLSDAFSGNIKGMGPGVAEMQFNERTSEPVIIFMADKTAAGAAWNMPLYKMFCDPFNTAGLVIAENMHDGFQIEVHDVKDHKKITFNTPEEIYDLLLLIGSPSRYCVKSVFTKKGEIAAVTSTDKVNLMAGRYVGKDDPVMIVRCQGTFPAVGEVLEPFALPFIVEGWMRGSHNGPLMPVGLKEANPTRFDGPPRVIAFGFQLADGQLVGPVDMFDDPSYDPTRQQANMIGEYLRRHGPFEPHRLPLDEMEYTTMPQVMRKLEGRFGNID